MPIPHQNLANALRFLSMDAVQRARSGHPGAPMGLADIATILWREFLLHDPNHPQWHNRDRFILSNGHASMLLYALLHLSGYPLSMEDLQHFRQLGSLTPGHPECRTPGVETTTGPLGQGFANAVGMAIAERRLANTFNRPQFPIVDHHTYVIVGDGCLMEGLSHEAASLAGNLRLGKLITFYDANGISIDGAISGWFGDHTAQRFAAYGWHVVDDIDGHDPQQIRVAIQQAQQDLRPSLLICNTVIGYGAPQLQGTARSHGAPLGDEEIAAARCALHWPYPPFTIPQPIYDAWSQLQRGGALQYTWQQLFDAYAAQYPQLAAEFRRRMDGDLPADFSAHSLETARQWQQQTLTIATRQASGKCLDAWAPGLPELFGGSADLSGSNLTRHAAAQTFNATEDGDYLHYGVREFAMAGIMNGIALHRGLIPFGGTFLVFADYARNAIRLSALMRQRVIYVLTHDSIGVGEDGPTHQPIEHLTMLRATPGLQVWRPCDAVETAIAWRAALLDAQNPNVLVLSRQQLPPQLRDDAQLMDIQRGGYILLEAAHDKKPQVIVIATGSEVAVAVAAVQKCPDIAVRVVSMPCCERFDAQDAAYRAHVLPSGIPRLAIEAASGDFWRKYVGLGGTIIGLDDFGQSAPVAVLMKYFGFTAEHVSEVLRALVAECV